MYSQQPFRLQQRIYETYLNTRVKHNQGKLLQCSYVVSQELRVVRQNPTVIEHFKADVLPCKRAPT